MTGMLATLALLAVPFASELVFSPRLTIEQYSNPKLAAILVLLGAAGLARPGTFHPRRLAGTPALAAWLAAVAVSTALSSSPLLSLIGAHSTLNGALTIAVCALLFMGATAAPPGFAPRFHAAVLAAGMLAAAYAVAGAAGADPFRGELFRHARAFAGNPDFLAQQLAMALPFAVAFAVTGRATVHLPAVILLAGALSLSGSRAGLVAAALGVVLVAGALRSRRGACARLAAVLAALVGGFAAGEALQSPATRTGTRLAGLAEPGTVSLDRGMMWSGVLSAVRERPLLGHGPDTLGTAFLRHAPPGWAAAKGAGTTAERAHNSILEGAAASGLIGLGALLWFAACWARGLPRYNGNPGIAAAAAAVAAYAAHNLFSFGTPATAPVIWVLLGLFPGLRRDGDGTRSGPGALALIRCAAALLALFGIVRLCAGGWAYRGNEAERAGGHAAPSAPDYWRAGGVATYTPSDYWRAATALAPFETAYLTRYGAALEKAGRFEEALVPYGLASARIPLNGIALGNLGRARFSAGLAGRDPPTMRLALAEMLKAAELSPSQPTLWMAASEAARRLGEKTLADELKGRMESAGGKGPATVR